MKKAQTKEENVSLQKQNEIRQYIKSDEVSKTINPEKQSRHIASSDGYIQGRSYLLEGIDVQELVDKYHGTGEIRFTKAGEWIGKEFIVVEENIGVDVNPVTDTRTITNRFLIHYSKTGTHIVPAKRRV